MKDLILLCEYHNWSINRMLTFIEERHEELFHTMVVSVFPSISKAFEHIYWADYTWLNRIKGLTDYNQLNFKTVGEALMAFNSLHEILITYLKGCDLDQKVVYQNSSGNQFENSVGEIITHLVNHGTYHKGNITAMLWALGQKSISTDYIVFIRDRTKK